jgi:hypothetical protein
MVAWPGRTARAGRQGGAVDNIMHAARLTECKRNQEALGLGCCCRRRLQVCRFADLQAAGARGGRYGGRSSVPGRASHAGWDLGWYLLLPLTCRAPMEPRRANRGRRAASAPMESGVIAGPAPRDTSTMSPHSNSITAMLVVLRKPTPTGIARTIYGVLRPSGPWISIPVAQIRNDNGRCGRQRQRGLVQA